MDKRWAGLAAVVVLAGACGASSAAADAVEDMPPLPETPSGWTLVGGFGGSGNHFTGVMGIEFGEGDVAINGACNGNGTLIVLVRPAESGDSGVGPSAVIPCGELGAPAVRFELAGMSIPNDATIRAAVIEGAGAIRHAAYQVAVEQREP